MRITLAKEAFNRKISIKLLSGLDDSGLWLIIHLLNVSPNSVTSLPDQQRETTPEDAAHRMRRNVEQQMYNQP